MSTDGWKKENTIRIRVMFTNNSGVPQALRRMTDQTRKTTNDYVREVIIDALRTDGYLEKQLKHPLD